MTEYIMGEGKIKQNADRVLGFMRTIGLHKKEIIRVIEVLIKKVDELKF